MGIADDMMKQILAEFEKMGKQPGSLDEINKIAALVNKRHNESPLGDFEGLSPSQMHLITSYPFGDNCLLSLNPSISAELTEKTLLVRMAVKLLQISEDSKGIKLTTSGNLPRALVKNFYEEFHIQSLTQTSYLTKTMNEMDYLPLHLCNMLLRISKYTRVEKGKLILTRSGRAGILDPGKLFADLFSTFCTRFNKAYFSPYLPEEIGNMGFLFILFLLYKFGKETREEDFYGDKYFTAFPMLLNAVQTYPGIDKLHMAKDGLATRVFHHGLSHFGLISIDQFKLDNFSSIYKIRTTELFEHVIVLKNN